MPTPEISVFGAPAHVRVQPAPGRADSAWLAAITALALALRLFQLGHKSVWLDESVSVMLAQIAPQNFFHWMTHPQQGNLYWMYNSLYYSFLHFWLKLGASEFLLRLPSALAGAAAVPLLYLLGKYLFSARAGLIAALLLAVQPFHLIYSQEGRAYAITMLLATFSFYCFVRAVEDDRPRWWWLYVLASIAMIYSHLYAALLLPPQFLALLFAPPRKVLWKKALPTFILIGVAIFPVSLAALRETTSLQPWTTAMGFKDLFHAVQDASGTGIKFPIYLGLMLAAFWGASSSSVEIGKQRWRAALLWGWLLLPVVAIAISLHFRMLFFSRYLVMCVPATMLLAAAGAARIRSPRIGMLIALCVAAMSLPADIGSYFKPKDDWRSAAAFVLAHAAPQDQLLFLPTYNQFPFEYYERLASKPLLPVADAAKLSASPAQRIWLVLTPDVSGGADSQTEKTWKQLSAQDSLLARQSFRAIHIFLFQPQLSAQPASAPADVR